jgi:hypothetical protein
MARTKKRIPKPPSAWTSSDLDAYKIKLVSQDFATFFETPHHPHPLVDNEILTIPNHHTAQPLRHDTYTLLRTMDLAMTSGEESAIDDFAGHLLEIFQYSGPAIHRIVRTRKRLSFLICDREIRAGVNIYVMDTDGLFRLVQENKRYTGKGSNPAPQLIAEAIAAFGMNNDKRTGILGRPYLGNEVILGISMVGTMPTFYKI